MCCYCCISLRGTVYFGTSVHIFIGLILSLFWGFKVYELTFETEQLFIEAFISIVVGLIGIYLLLFIMLGCLIFRGVEKRSLTLLKWSATGFTTLQVLVFTVILILYFVSPSGEYSFAESHTLPLEKQIMLVSIYFLSLVATANYIIVLILYIRKLWKPKPILQHHSKNTESSGGNLGNPLISSPIQHNNHNQPMTHYYRRGLQSSLSNEGTYPANPMPYRRPQQPTTPRYTPKPQQNHLMMYESVLDSPASRRDSLNSQFTPQQPCQPFYPANFYSTSMTRNQAVVPPTNQNIEGIYNQSQASTTSFINRYPYPHERYRFPLDSPRPVNESARAGVRSPSAAGNSSEGAYQHNIYGGVGGNRRQGTPTQYDQSAEPLLRRPNNTEGLT